jgi:hypothetical protein
MIALALDLSAQILGKGPVAPNSIQVGLLLTTQYLQQKKNGQGSRTKVWDVVKDAVEKVLVAEKGLGVLNSTQVGLLLTTQYLQQKKNGQEPVLQALPFLLTQAKQQEIYSKRN